MSEGSENSSTVTENSAESAAAAGRSSEYTSPRLFGRERSVHQLLGGGKYADVLMWRKKHVTGGILLGATAAYILFEWCQYTFLSILSNALLFLVVILFLWSTAAGFLSRPPPPVPEVQLSEEMVENIAQTLRLELNRSLGIVHVIALGKDYKLFLEVIAGLWLFSVIGGCFHFLTLLYIGVLLIHTLPVVYDKYEDDVDKYAKLVVEEVRKQYTRVDQLLLRKIPKSSRVKKAA